ncbi:MAG TPA: sigma-54 dependent transcriptional regulator [Gemmatimonadaceae bacterium]|nr:sigma-54 dependent transcriptional regulator [Gemmatimonadaceae bacterium]
MTSVLVIDDEANIRRMVGALLVAEGYTVHDAPSGNAGLEIAIDDEPDAVLLDLMMPGPMDGMAVLAALRERLPDVPVVMMSGRAGLADAVQAMKLGAFHFLEKPLAPEHVLLTLRSALELRRARLEARALREAMAAGMRMVGDSAAMRRVSELVRRVAATDARVLLMGESGTGKELVAAAIHRQSARRDEAFVRVNCAAIPRDLVESEMFGHEKGAFTGATTRRIGRFELAHRGTLLLDEVGDLGAEAQAKLLRAIESREIERVGGGKPIAVDVRIIAATNMDLERSVKAGRFREDLYFRLNVMPITLPPLRERPDDIPALVRHFSALHRARTGRPDLLWHDDALALLGRYPWPGNVRELANIVERLAILSPGAVTAADVESVLPLRGHQPPAAHGAPSSDSAVAPSARVASAALPDPAALETPLSDALDEYERLLITRALAMSGGNVADAARRLQTDRPNLYRRMRRLEIAWNEG